MLPALKLTDEEVTLNKNVTILENTFTFDPDFRLKTLEQGMRIFADNTCSTRYPTRRIDPGTDKPQKTIYLYTKLHNVKDHEPLLDVGIRIDQPQKAGKNERFHLTLDDEKIPLNSKTAWLAALLLALEKTDRDDPILICSTSETLVYLFVKKQELYANGMVDPCFKLYKVALSLLQERTRRVKFKNIKEQVASTSHGEEFEDWIIECQSDITFELPGIALHAGNQRLFTQIIKSRYARPERKGTFTNVERVRDTINEEFGYAPSNTTIWRSIRNPAFPLYVRDFFWKCFHNTFWIGDFWSKCENKEIRGECPICKVPETLEHIMLVCGAPERQIIWNLAKQLWESKYPSWPTLTYGTVLGCSLTKFKTNKGLPMRHKDRLFSIIVSISWRTIWLIRNDRRLGKPPRLYSPKGVHNMWLRLINAALRRDCILADEDRFGNMALKEDLVLCTWSGLLLDEDSLPVNWLKEKGVLVGILPLKEGVG
jgi:hypothetical protein